MKKFRVRDGERGDFEVHNVLELEGETASFLARAVTLAVLAVIVIAAGFFAFSGNGTELKSLVNSLFPLMAFVLGRYFKGSG